MRLQEGRMAKQFFPLMDFQEFIIAMIVGWRYKGTKKRSFKEAFVSMPKKNAKTALAAAIVTAIFFLEPDFGGQYMFAASTRKQANICFSATKKIIADLRKDDTDISAVSKIFSTAIMRTDTEGSIFSVSKEANNVEGQGGNVVVLDEWHLQSTDEMKDNLMTGQMAREDPLLLGITTAGKRLHTPCHTQYEYCEKVLDGVLQDDTLLILVWEVPTNKDDWKNMEYIEMANPCVGSSLQYSDLKTALDKALNKGGSAEADFKTKHCNQWVSSANVWIKDEHYQKCRKPGLKLLRNMLTYAGLDLAYAIDLCALTFFQPEQMFFDAVFYMAEGKMQNPDNHNYQKWIDQGHIILTPGDITDYDFVKKDIISRTKELNTAKIFFDRSFASQLSIDLKKENLPLDDYGQGARFMSPPINEIERLFAEKKIYHNGNPVLRWMMSNSLINENAGGLKFISRQGQKNKVDGVIGLLMAYAAYMNFGNIVVSEPDIA